MKFLDAKGLNREENKMQPGSRPDQVDSSAAMQRQRSSRADVRTDVRLLADELGVDLETVTGTGKGNTITMTDVRKAAALRDDPSGT